MSHLCDKKVVLGVTGGIAAYKSAELVRRLQDAGAIVRVVMTQGATEFVTPLTFQALSGNPVHLDLLDPEAEAAMGHIELARWADMVLIAPITANTMAKLAYGIGDNLLTTLCLATKAPLVVAPAMNHVMWSDQATQDNVRTLENRGVEIIGPASGSQACGETGEGRMLEPTDIVAHIENIIVGSNLSGTKVMITAGPTYEAIDPVRFIGNRSSGRMGVAIAKAAKRAGADVTLVCGPIQVSAPNNIHRIDVESALQMQQAVMDNINHQDIFIATAAVADYRPRSQLGQKMKKAEQQISIELERNPDILAEVASLDNAPFTVGFAAETQHVSDYAQQKLKEKGLDMIAANLVADAQISGEDIGFNSEYNALDVYWHKGHKKLDRASKMLIAKQLIELIEQQYTTKTKES